jgi:hypothetical protein
MKNHSDLQELQDFLRAALCDPASPQQLAISGSDEALSWLQLSGRDGLGAALSACQPVAGTPVVLYGHQQAEFAVAIYSCLLHNIPYIPVDCIYTRRSACGRSAIWPAPLTITTSRPGSSSPPVNGQGTGGAGSGLHHVYLRQHR